MELSKDKLFIQTYKSNKLFNDIVDKICKQYGINQVQLYILILSFRSEYTVTTLSQTLNLSRSAVSQALVGLLLRRLITKEPAQDNKKVFYIKPTKTASEIKDKVLKMCNFKYEIIEQKMTKEELDNFVNLLVKFNNILEEVRRENVDAKTM